MNTNLRKTIQQILLAGSAATFVAGAFASVGQQNPPPGPGQIPDYFGVVPNFANSPQPILATVSGGSGSGAAATTYDYVIDAPTHNVMDVQGGTGYVAGDTLTIKGGGAATCLVTVNQASPIITLPNNQISGGEIISVVDATTGAVTTPSVSGLANCTGFIAPIAGSGVQKFVDTLPQLGLPGRAVNTLGQILPIAVPDTTTFPGSDYYEIAETEYAQKLHRDLPATHLRGYKQLNVAPGNAAGTNQYLGPIIVAQKNRPVRVKLVNQLSKTTDSGLKGKIGVPVDTTYMGADGATDTENRTALHLHGGNTPWISDGTPRQWVKPKGEVVGPNKGASVGNVPDMWFDTSGTVIASCSGATTCAVNGATNNPGDGALTFFYTNEQSARLMFYHDHAEGTTRLNVYAGMAAGYVLQDPTEQDLVNGTNVSGNNPTSAKVLPPIEDTIPLVIQEKTFVPNNTQPVLNFYGPFASALASQDPTWRWGTNFDATNNVASPTGLMGNGDLWVPHVFMPNQNPGDVTGANAMGRWDYGAWFWPPFANLQNGPAANPYYDPSCNTTTMYCEGPEIPGVPNGSLKSLMNGGDTAQNIKAVSGGVPDANNGSAITESPSGTPEAFNDTPLVNGTAYPYLEVDPKQYRLRILSVGNDRMLNLSLVVAASKNSDTTALGNAGPTSASLAKLCDGNTPESASPADCTEVKMVPFDATQNKSTNTPFPSHWYTTQKAGVTFDGRPSGVFDPTTRGPAMVQIGTEGGFLSAPTVIKNQPVNYEYNPKNILIGNIKEHALLLGPAERADVLVDFSNFAGSTLILYNDAGAPVPAWDLRLDYYTGNYDNTDTGGAFSVIPGYGPNSRTLMQIRVSKNSGVVGASDSTHRDDIGNINLPMLTSAVQTAFQTSQEPIIVPQSVYNGVYGITAPDALGSNISRISDSSLTYTPLDPATHKLSTKGSVKLELEPKTIIEDWTMNWGRMNALLGTEVPRTTATIQTSIPQAFIDPPTELVKITPNDNMVPISGTLPDGTQLWKITHNGVDSHAIHFHLFHVQLVNRVGWDGAIYPPAANELGWKDTVLMHPLSDVVVAMRPMVMKNLPFKVPNSHRLLNPALAANATSTDFFNLNPLDGNASTVSNVSVNYGWEYLWHCHILGHEENDMMRTIAVAQPPEAPSITTATGTGTTVAVKWTDNSIISNWVTIQRSLDSTFTTIDKTVNVLVPECANQAGCPQTYTDTTAPKTSVYYRVMANNTVGAGDGKLDAPRNLDGSYGATLPPELSALVPGLAGYANVTANSSWSNTALRPLLPNAVLSTSPATNPIAVAFGNQAINTTSGAKTVTLSNTGPGNMTITGIASSGAPFARSGGTCPSTFPATLNAGATCTMTVTFAPTAGGAVGGTLAVTDNSAGVAGSIQSANLTGTGVVPVTITPDPLTFANQNVGTSSAAQTVTFKNVSGASLTLNSNGVTFPAGFARATGNSAGTCNWTGNTNARTIVNNATCTIGIVFSPSTSGVVSGNLIIANSTGSAKAVLSGTGVAVVQQVTAVNDTATATSTAANSILAQTVTVNVRANDTPANTGTVTIVGAVLKSGNPVPTATAAAAVTNGNVVLTLTANGALLSAARTASKRGVYTVTYLLNVNGTTSQATATITVN
jgi:FtsP/CotA-like multicopper oxidase with cupredoxin domain